MDDGAAVLAELLVAFRQPFPGGLLVGGEGIGPFKADSNTTSFAVLASAVCNPEMLLELPAGHELRHVDAATRKVVGQGVAGFAVHGRVSGCRSERLFAESVNRDWTGRQFRSARQRCVVSNRRGQARRTVRYLSLQEICHPDAIKRLRIVWHRIFLQVLDFAGLSWFDVTPVAEQVADLSKVFGLILPGH
jgi:hypothetical protein